MEIIPGKVLVHLNAASLPAAMTLLNLHGHLCTSPDLGGWASESPSLARAAGCSEWHSYHLPQNAATSLISQQVCALNETRNGNASVSGHCHHQLVLCARLLFLTWALCSCFAIKLDRDPGRFSFSKPSTLSDLAQRPAAPGATHHS